jgi:hypothetical protein
MASERQIAANRRNASKSAGPRSQAGKSRASRNAYRHGLSRSISTNTAFAKQVETLAQEMAGDSDDGSVLDCARAVAEAELDLERIRQTKVALIERVRAFGGLERPEICRSVTQIARFLKARGIFIPPKVIDPLATIPSEEPARTADAMRRVLPELLKLDRYERRAFARREGALRRLSRAKSQTT